MKNKYLNKIGMIGAATLIANDAFAAGNANLNQILDNTQFKAAVTLGFAIFAFFKWIEYFVGFSVSNALKDIILPAMLTFLTFKWTEVLGWVGLK